MGIALSFTPFFDLCMQKHALGGRMMVLGSQVLHDPAEQIVQFARKYGHSRLALNPNVRTFFTERFKVSEYCDCDMNGLADLNLNISMPLPPELTGRFDTVLDAGTLEHVFDIAACYRNIHDMVKPGGVIIHISPMTWHNHAFYNLNPVTFHKIAKANNYTIAASAYHYIPPGLWFLKSRRPKVVITDENSQPRGMCTKQYILRNILYMIAYRKTSIKEFVMPYDVAEK